jgi:hypothetical protein
MKIETLKILVLNTINRDQVLDDETVQYVEALFDLYEKDNEGTANPFPSFPTLITDSQPLRYGDLCPCNPKNGGDGICGCIMANEPVNTNSPYIKSLTNE